MEEISKAKVKKKDKWEAYDIKKQHTGWAKKRGHRLITIILSNLTTFFSLQDSIVNLQLNGY